MVRVERRGVRRGPLAAFAAALLLHSCGSGSSPRLNSDLPAPTGFTVNLSANDDSLILLEWATPASGFDALIAEYSLAGQAWSELGRVTQPATSATFPLPADAATELTAMSLRLTVAQGTRQSSPATVLFVVPVHRALDVIALQAFDDGPMVVQWQNGSSLADGVHLDRQSLALDGGSGSLSSINGLTVADFGWQYDYDLASWVEGARIDYCVVYTLGDAGSLPACALSPYGPPLSPIDFVASAYDAGSRVALTWTTRSSIADAVGVLRQRLFHFDGGELFEVPAAVSSASDEPPTGAWSYQLETRWHSEDAGVVSSLSRFGYAVREDSSWKGGLGVSVTSLPRAMELQRLANGQFATAMGSNAHADSKYVWAAAGADFGWSLGLTTGDQVGLIPNSLMVQGSTASVLWLKSVSDTTAELHQLSYTDHWTDVLASSEVTLTLASATVTHDGAGVYYLVNPTVTGLSTTEGRDQTWKTQSAPLSGSPAQFYGLTTSEAGLRLLFPRPDTGLSLATRQADGGWTVEDVPPAGRPILQYSTHLVSAPGRLAFVYEAGADPLATQFFVQERTPAGWGAPVKVADHVFDGSAYDVDVAYSPDGSRLAVAITGESTPQLLVRDAAGWISWSLFPTTTTPVVGFSNGKVWVMTGTDPGSDYPPSPSSAPIELVPYLSYFER
jgi:hypothetical protein